MKKSLKFELRIIHYRVLRWMSRVLVLKETCKSWDIDRGWCGNKERQLWQRLIIHLNLVKIKTYIQSHRSATCIYLPARFIIIPRSPKGWGILFYLCPSVQDFFVAFFSVTVDGRNLIFGHKRHIGIPYCG